MSIGAGAHTCHLSLLSHLGGAAKNVANAMVSSIHETGTAAGEIVWHSVAIDQNVRPPSCSSTAELTNLIIKIWRGLCLIYLI